MIQLSELWRAHPKQELFLSCPVYEVMYGGAKGGGKSDALLMGHVEQHQLVHENWRETGRKTRGRALILRKEFGRLKDMINRAHMVIPVLTNGAMTWRENDHTHQCKQCGYRLEFGHLEGPQAHQLYQGQEFSWLGFDQVEEIPYEQYSYLKLQVRSSEELLQPTLAVRCTANPLGRFADWVKRRFVDPAPDGFALITETITLDNGVQVVRQRTFIPATLFDNPSLPAEYAAELMAAPEHMRRAYLYGDWNVTVGSFFGDVFDPNIHVIDDLGPTEIGIASNWPITRHADWGARNPAACYWTAVDNDGLLIVLDELYGPGEEPERWGRKILRIEEQWGWLDSKGYSKVHGYIDPAACKTDSSGGPTVVEKMYELGLSWFPADNERKAGWVEVRRRLMERGGISRKIPGLRICRRCVNLIRTLPNLTAPENASMGDMDDVDTKQEDHAADALRYGCMSRPAPRHARDVVDEEIKRWERISLAQQHGRETSRNTTTGY